MQDAFVPGEIANDVENQIRHKVEEALEALRKQKEPKIDMQARCITRYRQTSEFLN